MELLRTAAGIIYEYGNAFIIYLALMNLIAFILYALDKFKAKRHMWRIPEATLLAVSFLGGSIGAILGMRLLRHKTKHIKFIVLVPLSLILHIVIITAVVILSH